MRAQKFIQGLKTIALFDFIPTEYIFEKLGLTCEDGEGVCFEATPSDELVGVQRLVS